MKKTFLFAIPVLMLCLALPGFSRPAPADGLFSRLRANDTLTLQFTSRGCFHSSSSKLLFIQKESGIEVVRFATRNNMARQRLVPDSVISRKRMTGADLAAFAGFEQELGTPKGDGCTTRDSYAITSKYDTLAVNDGSCQWNGFGKLTVAIFGE